MSTPRAKTRRVGVRDARRRTPIRTPHLSSFAPPCFFAMSEACQSALSERGMLRVLHTVDVIQTAGPAGALSSTTPRARTPIDRAADR